MEQEPGEVTRLLHELKRGNKLAEEQLFQLLYREMRQIAANILRGENPGNSLQPTLLINELYLRFTRMENVDLQSRSHFFALCARIMRRITVDHARNVNAQKRGNGLHPVTFDDAFLVHPERPEELLALDEALTALELESPRKASVIEMFYFGGMTDAEIAEVLDLDPRTIKRDLKAARIWLYEFLTRRP